MASEYRFLDFGPSQLEVTLVELPQGCVLGKAVAVYGTDRRRAGDRLLRVRGQLTMVVMEVDPSGVAVFMNEFEFGPNLLPITFSWETKDADETHHLKSKMFNLQPHNWLVTLKLQLHMQTAVHHERGILGVLFFFFCAE
jgi:hypothetical protein